MVIPEVLDEHRGLSIYLFIHLNSIHKLASCLQEWSDSYPHSHKAVSIWGEGLKIYIFLNLMLNLKNNENDAVFDKI